VAVLNKADLPGYDSEELGDVRRELSARLGVDQKKDRRFGRLVREAMEMKKR